MRTNQLMLFKHMEHGELLKDMTFLMENCENEYYNKEDLTGLFFEVMNELRKLINARNAYWKLYDKANGLGGSWKPDWDDGCYVIFTNGDGLIKMDIQFGLNAILAFPTEELRDMFYERFKKEIELCKELI